MTNSSQIMLAYFKSVEKIFSSGMLRSNQSLFSLVRNKLMSKFKRTLKLWYTLIFDKRKQNWLERKDPGVNGFLSLLKQVTLRLREYSIYYVVCTLKLISVNQSQQLCVG